MRECPISRSDDVRAANSVPSTHVGINVFIWGGVDDRYDEADQEQLTAVSRHQIFAFLSNDVAVLARNLTARGGNGTSFTVSLPPLVCSLLVIKNHSPSVR